MSRLYFQGLVVLVSTLLSVVAGGRHISQLPGLELPPDFVPEPLQCDRQGPFPYVVSLRDGSNRHFCGGVVISQNTVATAASCLGRPASDIILAIGGFDVSNPVETRRAQSTETHPLWSGDPRKGHDIGIIRLDAPTCGTPIPFIGGRQSTGQTNQFLGFGRTGTNEPFSESLLVGDFVTKSPAVCSQANAQTTGWVSSSTFCTVGPGGNGGLCEGDAGGPLIYRPSNFVFKDQLVGIGSFVSGSGKCSDPGTFGVFTDINHFASWLHPFLQRGGL